MEENFDDACSGLRKDIDSQVEIVHSLMEHSIFVVPPDGIRDHGEMRANIMLAVRHLEDARMRLGKAIQAFDGGTSVYDK